MMIKRVESIRRLGGDTASCGHCQTALFEEQAFLLRRLWLSPESKSVRILMFACTRKCAEVLREASLETARACQKEFPGEDSSSVWIDESHLAKGIES